MCVCCHDQCLNVPWSEKPPPRFSVQWLNQSWIKVYCAELEWADTVEDARDIRIIALWFTTPPTITYSQLRMWSQNFVLYVFMIHDCVLNCKSSLLHAMILLLFVLVICTYASLCNNQFRFAFFHCALACFNSFRFISLVNIFLSESIIHSTSPDEDCGCNRNA